jgi:hypothetical protein
LSGLEAMAGRWKWIVLALLLVIAGMAFFSVRPILYQAGAATEYVARRACLCVYKSERSLARCLVEMPGMVAQVEAELLEEERGVRAWISFIAERTARYDGSSSCTLE